MAIEIVEKYVNELIDRSTLEEPVWNIEKIRAGKKASWDYIDGCMIMSLLELYKVGRNEKYFKFAEEYISYRVQEDGTITRKSLISTISMKVRTCSPYMI